MTGGNEHQGFAGPDLDPVARAYQRLPKEEPPALLDQAVLNSARRAAAGKTVRPWNFGWIHAFSTAAVVVLGLALLLQQPDPPAGEPLRVNKPPNSKLERPARRTPALRVPAPAGADADAPPGVVREVRLAPQAQEPSATEPGGRTPPKTSKAARSREDLHERAGLMASDSLVPEEETSEALEQKAVASSARLKDQAMSAQDREVSETARSPEAWLNAILDLKARGETAAFEAELEAFRAAWPEFPLPPELTE
jgi:hypothetical protein